ncbi:MAG: hypothetical protein A2X49_11445 [Lentisphaerae bacterium GWF2_52_8]|nr:MAG: hypothetical protein A2X49_11445 [Lentisphaerae bacterium GWF2_52_8]
MKKQTILILASLLMFSAATLIVAEDGEGKKVRGNKAAREKGDKTDNADKKADRDAKIAEKKAEIQEKIADKKAEREAKTAERKTDKEAKSEEKNKGRENSVDKRQANQEKRIEHGINKGYLTADEAKTLQDQQQKIADMESSFKSDGKITKDEAKQLRSELNTASANIWAEKHDTDGNQMATYRLGKNVYAKDSYTSQLSNPNLTGAEAKAISSDFRKMLEMKRTLATGNLSEADQAKMQSGYNDLLNKYFEVR